MAPLPKGQLLTMGRGPYPFVSPVTCSVRQSCHQRNQSRSRTSQHCFCQAWAVGAPPVGSQPNQGQAQLHSRVKVGGMGLPMASHAQKRNPALARQGPIRTGLPLPAWLRSHNQQQRATKGGQGSAPTGSGAIVRRQLRGHQQPGAMGWEWRRWCA